MDINRAGSSLLSRFFIRKKLKGCWFAEFKARRARVLIHLGLLWCVILRQKKTTTCFSWRNEFAFCESFDCAVSSCLVWYVFLCCAVLPSVWECRKTGDERGATERRRRLPGEWSLQVRHHVSSCRIACCRCGLKGRISAWYVRHTQTEMKV